MQSCIFFLIPSISSDSKFLVSSFKLFNCSQISRFSLYGCPKLGSQEMFFERGNWGGGSSCRGQKKNKFCLEIVWRSSRLWEWVWTENVFVRQKNSLEHFKNYRSQNWEVFNFELGNFYSGGRHFGASRIWAPTVWPITLVRPVILGYEFQFFFNFVHFKGFFTSILALSVCHQNELFVYNFFV